MPISPLSQFFAGPDRKQLSHIISIFVRSEVVFVVRNVYQATRKISIKHLKHISESITISIDLRIFSSSNMNIKQLWKPKFHPFLVEVTRVSSCGIGTGSHI